MQTRSLEEVVQSIRRGANTRAKLLDELEWSRTTLTARIDDLTKSGVLRSGEAEPSTGGRPATTIELNPHRGLILSLDIGGSHARLALCAADATVVRTADLEAGRTAGPERIADWLRHEVQDRELERVIAIGAGLPVAPPQFTHVESVAAARAWETFSPANVLRLDVPEVFARDVAVVARGEAEHPEVASNALVVKIGLGLSMAIVADHNVVDGAHSAAGAFLVTTENGFVAAEDLHSGYTVREVLTRDGLRQDTTSSDIVRLSKGTDELAAQTQSALKDMADRLGVALTPLVAFADPEEVLIGGNLGESDVVVDSLRDALLRNLHSPQNELVRVRACRRAREAGIIGAANLALDALTTQRALETRIRQHKQEAA